MFVHEFVQFFYQNVLKLRIFLAGVSLALVRNEGFVSIFYHMLGSGVSQLLHGHRPAFAFLLYTGEESEIFKRSPLRVQFRRVKVVHPTLSTLLGIAEKTLARADEKLTGNRIPSVLVIFFTGFDIRYLIMIWRKEVYYYPHGAGLACGLRRDRLWNSKKTVLLWLNMGLKKFQSSSF